MRLQLLGLADNKLTAIPPEIGDLMQLRSLKLGGNQLASLPRKIGNLIQLRSLDLGGNQLASLPPEIGRLTALIALNLKGNQLTALPPEIGDLIELIELSLANNLLVALPPEIDRLTALRSLNLRNNQLEALPSEIIRWIELVRTRGGHIPNTPQPLVLTLEENLRSSAQVFTDTFPAHLLENAKYYVGDRIFDFQALLSLDPDNLYRFSEFLPRIPEIADFEQGTSETKKNVILRVDRMVQLACKNSEFREEMLQILEALETECSVNRRACADRILTLFNEIEIAWQFYHKKLSHEEYRDLALREGRYKWIEEIGKKIAEEKGLLDEIETVLGLQLELKNKKEFELPISTTQMSFPGASGVDNAMIKETTVKLRAKTPSQLLSKSEHWLKHQAEQFPQEVERIQQEYANLDAMAAKYYKTNDAQIKEAILQQNPMLVRLFNTLDPRYRHHASLANAIMKARVEAIAGIGEEVSRPKVFESKTEG